MKKFEQEVAYMRYVCYNIKLNKCGKILYLSSYRIDKEKKVYVTVYFDFNLVDCGLLFESYFAGK